jgi:GxxExxY protein
MSSKSIISDPLTERIITCIIRVHRTLGAGYLEDIYRRALLLELRKQGLVAEVEKRVIIYYDGQPVGRHRLDLVVEGEVVVELKVADSMKNAHYTQVRSYLKASSLRLALLVNFAGQRADFRRIESPFYHVKNGGEGTHAT